ncbi:2-dehydro-3-deoxyphosphooctonate aldolase [Flavobacterium sp. MK4S-17]|uniref:2-dehydro-3-deoxyphosphooctonate aldolase n=1 Tax=Flavobacterium sp. MK4S-17 TaxID=2543737 RepID=UPI00135AF1FA|nr:2-dehydro-3-deoxyphosphooctonate aldolase [Flavobacterium sp. MK4S-17]
MRKIVLACFMLIIAASCISTRNTIKNIDNNANMPALSKERTFIITEISNSDKYGYDPDYPVNLGFLSLKSSEVNVDRYFGALTGPQGQKLIYNKIESCCPFPSKRNDMGAGILDIYEVKWEGLKEPKRIHINLYEKGEILAPLGFGIKKIE